MVGQVAPHRNETPRKLRGGFFITTKTQPDELSIHVARAAKGRWACLLPVYPTNGTEIRE